MNHRSLLVATFQLLPSSADDTVLDPLTTYTHNSTRPTAMYGPSQPWPLACSAPAPTSHTGLNDFLSHSAASLALSVNGPDSRHGFGPSEGGSRTERYISFVSTETRITMAKDYPAYGLGGYIKGMESLRDFKACPSLYDQSLLSADEKSS
jgi:hypothetical protein